MGMYFDDKRKEVLTQIVDYFNNKYKNIIIKLNRDEFVINGDKVESEECRKEIEEILKSSAKKIKNSDKI